MLNEVNDYRGAESNDIYYPFIVLDMYTYQRYPAKTKKIHARVIYRLNTPFKRAASN